jgi:hypothetical protein
MERVIGQGERLIELYQVDLKEKRSRRSPY